MKGHLPKTSVRVRPALPGDAGTIATMANALNRELGVGGDPFTAEGVREQAFGAKPAYAVLVGECDGRVAGYALYERGFNSDNAAAAIYLLDLYVEESWRRRGLGRALMAAVAREAIGSGAKTLAWGVRETNANAIAFYRALGSVDPGVRMLELKGAALDSLARLDHSS